MDIENRKKLLNLKNTLPKNQFIPSNRKAASFSDENIKSLFGYDAAESEPIESLKKCYFKSDIYHQICAQVNLRVLVGHKGIGKSALFKVAASEDIDNGIVAISIHPDDIVSIKRAKGDFFEIIRAWKDGLSAIITRKLIEKISDDNLPDTIKDFDFKQPIKNIINAVLGWFQENSSAVNASNRPLLEALSKNKKVSIYIDDLDRGWQGSTEDIQLISALFNAVRDMISENMRLYFRISLRSDIYFLFRTSDESTDKIGSDIVWFRWSNAEILALYVKRVQMFLGNNIPDADLQKMTQEEMSVLLEPIMESEFTGRGKWENVPIHRVLLSLIRKRPRDLIKLSSLAAQEAYKRNASKIQTQDWSDIFDGYSQERLQDTVNEFKSELPDVERLLFAFKPSTKRRKKYEETYVLKTDGVKAKIDDSAKNKPYCFSYRQDIPAEPTELLTFLYKINFLTARHLNKDNVTVRKYFEESRYLSHPSRDFGFDWEAHPAFRWALEPDDPYVIFDKLELIPLEK